MQKLVLLLAGGLAAAGCSTTRAPSTQPDVIVTVPPPSAPLTRFPGDGVIMPDRNMDLYLEGLEPAAGGGGGSGDTGTAPPPSRDFLPFTDVGQTPYAQQISGFGQPLMGSYTRIRIVNDDRNFETEVMSPEEAEGSVSGFRKRADARIDRDYGEESRGWLSRRFASRKVTRAFLVEFDLDDPDITASTALFSSSFESSSSKGESWSTDESLSAFATPWFRVGSNTVLNAAFKLRLAEEGDADVGANVVTALTSAATLMMPASPLITTFTAPQITQASAFLDSSVSNLFGRSIEETTTSAMALKTWSPDPIFVIELAMPGTNDIKDGSSKATVGRWVVYLDQPVISVLTGASSVAELDLTGMDPGSVLAFKIGEDLTVYDYIFARLDLSNSITSLNDAVRTGASGTAQEEARRICTRVSRGLAEVGLNGLDIAISWWALSETEAFDRAASIAMLNPSLCQASMLWNEIPEYNRPLKPAPY